MSKLTPAQANILATRREAPLVTPSDLAPGSSTDIAAAMNAILADIFALYLKNKLINSLP
jgi:starvation-inducible DNA-binding protein